MRLSWMYKLGQNTISIVKEAKDLGLIIQDNLSPEKHINKIFGDTFMMLRNILTAFHLPDDEMIRPKLEYTEVIWSPHKKKRVKIRKNTENCD